MISIPSQIEAVEAFGNKESREKGLNDSADQIDIQEESSLLNQKGKDILAYAKKLGASQAEVGISKDIGLSVSVRNQSIETLEYNRDNGCGISVYFGQRKGNASTSNLSDSALKEAVEAACKIAKYTQPDPFSGLADENLMATTETELDLDHPMGINAEQAKTIALECEQFGLAYSDKITNSEGGSLSSHRNLHLYTNSHGFSSFTPSTRISTE